MVILAEATVLNVVWYSSEYGPFLLSDYFVVNS